MVYWDTDGTTAGAGGATPAGTWKTSGGANKNWSTSAAGTATTTVWTNDDIAVFSAGTDATGSYTVTVASAPTVDSIVIEEGNLTFNNSSLTLTGTTPSIDVASGLTATFNTKLLGSNGLVKTGSGTLLLASTGNNYTGDTSVSAGTLQVGTGASILPTATAVAVSSGATFEILAGSSTQRIASLAGAGTVVGTASPSILAARSSSARKWMRISPCCSGSCILLFTKRYASSDIKIQRFPRRTILFFWLC